MIFSNIVGRLLPWKGLDIYLNAIKDIDTANASFEFVGKRDENESQYYDTLYKTAESERVTVRDFIDDIVGYYRTIDVLVHTAVEPDPLPTVVIEALWLGKVIIASDVGGVREIVDDSYGNIIVPPGDSESLRRAIIDVSTYPDEKMKMIARKNTELAKSKFSLRKQVETIQNIYLELYRR